MKLTRQDFENTCKNISADFEHLCRIFFKYHTTLRTEQRAICAAAF